MDALSNVMDKLVTKNMTDSHSSKPCPVCHRNVPAIEIDVLGSKRWVQPVCKCVADAERDKLDKLINAKRESDLRQLLTISNIGKKYTDLTFENFEVRPGAENAFKLSHYYANNFDEFGKDSMFLWGDPGNGKTMLAACIHNHLTAQGYKVVFISMIDLLSKIKSTFNKNNPENESDVMRSLILCDLLIIDDIGAEKTGDWVLEKITEIVDARYTREKPILATSNINPKDLVRQVGKRVCDRLIEMSQPIENTATSYRREIAKVRMSKFDEILNGGI